MLPSFFVEAAHLSSNKMARRERRERGFGGATGTGLLGLATHHHVIFQFKAIIKIGVKYSHNIVNSLFYLLGLPSKSEGLKI